MSQLTEEQVKEKLAAIEDPEMFIDIVNLGLIYDISITTDQLTVTMTMTTPACPLGPWFEEQIQLKLGEITDKTITVEFTFDPPWSMDMMSEEAKIALGVL